ncbi:MULTISPECIES: hypothetical protein [unclassified Nonomuraea]|uniref:hypothetical protein n=1 Tax=unclassified Nonomuraea TaxID=2593643 RepID=UPI0033E5E572
MSLRRRKPRSRTQRTLAAGAVIALAEVIELLDNGPALPYAAVLARHIVAIVKGTAAAFADCGNDMDLSRREVALAAVAITSTVNAWVRQGNQVTWDQSIRDVHRACSKIRSEAMTWAC